MYNKIDIKQVKKIMNKETQILKNILLVVILIVCIWIGWSDFLFDKAEMPLEEIQAKIRDSIRYNIRYGIQIMIKYVIPVSIAGYFIQKFS